MNKPAVFSNQLIGDVNAIPNGESCMCVTVQYVIVDIPEKNEWHGRENKGREREHNVN